MAGIALLHRFPMLAFLLVWSASIASSVPADDVTASSISSGSNNNNVWRPVVLMHGLMSGASAMSHAQGGRPIPSCHLPTRPRFFFVISCRLFCFRPRPP